MATTTAGPRSVCVPATLRARGIAHDLWQHCRLTAVIARPVDKKKKRLSMAMQELVRTLSIHRHHVIRIRSSSYWRIFHRFLNLLIGGESDKELLFIIRSNLPRPVSFSHVRQSISAAPVHWSLLPQQMCTHCRSCPSHFHSCLLPQYGRSLVHC